MDSYFMSRVLRQLFSHQTCSTLRYSRQPVRHGRILSPSIRHFSNSPRARFGPQFDTEDTGTWSPRQHTIPPSKLEDIDKYPMVTSESLRGRKSRPRKVKMLMRDFIEDSLYNPQYGYFSKQAVIFSPGEPFDFNKIKNEAHFFQLLSQKYKEFEDALDYDEPNDTRQLWHTPTELFRPYYSEAITRYIVDNYKLTSHPYHDLIVYEMGAGNGTMILSMLDHIRDIYPDVYERSKVKIIEISSSLAALQTKRLLDNADARGHKDHVEIINRSIFQWNTYVPEPCYFLALEVFDNFAHDAISYDLDSYEARQEAVLIDGDGEFYPFLLTKPEALASRYLRVRDAACDHSFKHPLRLSMKQRLLRTLPFASPTSISEYIPSRLMQFFDILHRYFPHHRLIASDFHSLTDTVAGVNAPVVQTRYKRQTIPVTTPLVHQGYFDILFPTDFQVAEDMYRAITGKLTRVMTQEEFLKHWAYLEDTRTMDGDNPMLHWYKNASVMLTV